MTVPTTFPSTSDLGYGEAQPNPAADREPNSLSGLSARDQAKLVDWVKRQWEQGKSARLSYERQWYLNLAFFAGKQNVEFFRQSTSPLGVRLRVPDAPPWRIRLVINRIRPIIRKEQAKLISSKPQFVAVPGTNDDNDIAAARAAEKLLEAQWSDLNLGEVERQMVWWGTVCGTSFMKDWWDPMCGPLDPSTGQSQGDIKVQHVDPFHLVVPDLAQQCLDYQPWVIHATTHPQEWVRTNLGKDVSEKATVASTEAIMEDVLSGQYTPKPTRQVLCLEAWIQKGAHRDFPDGGLVTVVGDQLLQVRNYAKDGPAYGHEQLPFSKFEHIPMGRFYADSTITDLIPIQRELNRTRSQITESKNMMSKPKWLAPKQSVDAEAISSEPGQVIQYEIGYGGKPEMVQPPGLPGYVMQQVEQLQVDFDDVSGQHQISRGNAPSHTAASAIAYLQEQDDTLLSYTVASLEDAMARVGQHVLSHVRQFWTGPRLVRIVGMDGSFDAMQFKASDFQGVADVRVQTGSSLPVSKAARTATLMDLYSKGVFGPPGAPSQGGGMDAGGKLLAALDLGGLDKAMEEFEVDRRQVDRENILMTQGMQVPVNAYDNDAAHMAGHQRFQKGQEFAMLPPEIQMVFSEHVAEHQSKQLAAMTLGGQAGPEGAMPGGLPPIPGAGLPSGPEGPQGPPSQAASPGPAEPPPSER